MGWICFLLLVVTPHFVWGAPIKDPNPVLRSGDLLPTISCPNLLLAPERTYLGIGDQATFPLNDVQGDLVVIKFLNTNCVYCIKLLPTFDQIFQKIQQDDRLKARAKILAIGAGDTSTELDDFKKQYSIPYPVIPDMEFKAHKAVGEPRVPFIVVARKDKQGQWIVAMVNIGLIFSAESFVGELKSILEVDPEGLRLKK
jgi:thiol-disulfide isomerase/thioredoxin